MKIHTIRTVRKIVSSLTIVSLIFSSTALYFQPTYAQEATPSAELQESPTPSPAEVTPSSPSPSPAVNTIPSPSVIPLFEPASPSAMINNVFQKSGHEEGASSKLRRPTKLRGLSKHLYRANESITISVEQDPENNFNATLVGKDGERTELELYEKLQNDTVGTISILPPRELTPGEYTIEMEDSAGKKQSFDILWGVLAINTNKSVYAPGETAKLAMAVLDEFGEMVCDAEVTLEIKNPNGETKTLTTKDDIHVTDVCTKKIFTMEPDYKAEYQTADQGIYEMKLTAKTKNGTNTINDAFEVSSTAPFDIERSAPTRTYPVHAYPVTLSITAREDFKGEIKDVVPYGFDISAPKERDGQSAPARFDRIDTVEQETPLENGEVLGETTTNVQIIKPFSGEHVMTLGFGEGYHDENLVKAITDRLKYKGHEGIDFDMPEGTPILAASDGDIIIAGIHDYGLTVVMQHPWGRTYYGHLSEIAVKEGDHVTSGMVIGKSGNSGTTTGPHLHFGLKLDGADEQNGYGGMSDPIDYIPELQNKLNSKVLGETTISNNKVKEVVWSVDIKKGDTIRIGYEFVSPPDSPRLYLLGEARFENVQEDKTTKVIFAEKRKWQVAVDVGDGTGMLAYDEDQASNTTPHYRTWDASDLSAEGQMQDEETAGEESNFTIIEASPTRNEYIRGALTSSGHLDIQMWNGSNWVDGSGAPTNGEFTTGIGTTNDAMRGFDIAYEDITGDAIVVYESTSTADKALKYRTWDGSTWSSEQSLDYTSVAEGGSNDVAVWVELESDPGSDNILLGWQDKTGLGYYGARWDGSAFQNVSLINGAGVAVARQGFDVAWEGTSGEGMIAYITASTTDFSTYVVGSGFADGSGSVNPNIAQATGGWMRLAGDPNSDYIAMIDLMAPTTNPTTTSDLYVDMWNGSDWSTITTPTADTDINTYGFAQGADVVWEEVGSDRALFVWRDGTTSETALRYMVFDISVGQFLAIDDDGGGANVCNLTGTLTNQQVTSLTNAENSNGPCTGLGTWAGKVSGINLNADSFSRKIMLNAENETTLDIRPEAMVWNGVDSGTWLTQTTNMGAYEADASTGVLPSASLPSMPYDFAYKRYNTITISGSCDEFDQTTDCSDDGSNEIRFAINGVLNATLKDTTVDGAWSIANVPKPAANSIVTVFINTNADNNEAVAVAEYDGTGDITGIKLLQRHLSIGSDDNQTLSNTNLSQYDNSVSGDEDIFFDVDSGDDLTVDSVGSYTDEELYILASNTFQPGTGNVSTVTTVDVENLGTFDITANTVNVAGSWVQSGTFSDTCSGTTTGTNASLVNFTATSTGKTLSGTLNGSSDFCKVNFNGSSGGWTIQSPMLVSSANATDTFSVSAGTVTLGNGGGDNLDVRGKFTVSASATFQSMTGLAQGDTTYCNSDDICIEINANSSPPSCSNCTIANSGTFDIDKNVTVRLNSNASVESGIDNASTGYLELQGTQDDTGTDTGTDATGALRETKICANESYANDDHNNKYVRMSSGLARGRVYQITDTFASDTECATDSDDSLLRADTSSTQDTNPSVSCSGNKCVITASIETMITAAKDAIGRYIHDTTGTEGYYLIIDSTETGSDTFTVIGDPSTLALVTGDDIEISDGVRSGDTYEILDYAEIVGNTTNNGYIHNASGSEMIMRYAKATELGAEVANKYGINGATINAANASEGFLVEKSYIDNSHRTIRCDTCSNLTESNTSGAINNYIYNFGSEGVDFGGGSNNEVTGNRITTWSAVQNGEGIIFYSSTKSVLYNNIISDVKEGFTLQLGSGHAAYGNKVYDGSTYGVRIDDSEENIIVDNDVFGSTAQGMYIPTTETIYLGSNRVDIGTVHLDTSNSSATNIIAAEELYGYYSGASTADVRYQSTGAHKARFYNSYFGSGTEVSGATTTNAFLASFKHDQTGGLTQMWNDYVVPDSNAETPQSEETEKYNYADNIYEDSATPHYYTGTGTEDSDIQLTLTSALSTVEVYRAVVSTANGDNPTFTISRSGGTASPTTCALSGGTCTYTEASTGVRFTIQDGATNYVVGDTYTFMVFPKSASTNTQKTLKLMQTSDGYTVGSGETVQLIGTSSSNTLIQKDSGSSGYDFSISGGTINAQDYSFTGQAAAGLNISSGTVTSLSSGTFDDHAGVGASDTYITVAAAILNAGAVSFSSMSFDPSTSDSAVNYNVVLSGTPSSCSNTWTFSSSGNKGGATNGEANDNEPVAETCNSNRGYLLWNDNGPTNDQLMRHGNWFSGGVEQSFTF